MQEWVPPFLFRILNLMTYLEFRSLGLYFHKNFFFLFVSGTESDEVSNISMIGGKLWEVLSLIGSVSKFFDLDLSGIYNIYIYRYMYFIIHL